MFGRAVVVVLAALALAAPAACAALGPPQRLASPAEQAWWSWSAAGFGDGSAFVAALVKQDEDGESRRLVVFAREPGQPFGAPRTLAAGEDLSVEGLIAGERRRGGLATDRGGAAVLAWQQDRAVHAVTRRPDRTFGDVQHLGSGTPGRVLTSVSPRGDALVLWTAPGKRLMAALQRSGDERFAPAVDLGPVRDALHVVVAALPDGFALAWDVCPRGRYHCGRPLVRAARVRGDGGSSRPQTLGPVHGEPTRLHLLAGAQGDVLALWSGANRGFVRAARLARGASRFAPARTISDRRVRARSVDAAAGRAGGLAAWMERGRDGEVRIVGAEIDPRLRIGAPYALSKPTPWTTVPSVAVQDDGAAAVWWRPVEGRHDRRIPRRVAGSWSIRTRAPGGSLAPAAVLTSGWGATVRFDGRGDVVAVMPGGSRPGAECMRSGSLLGAVWPAGGTPRLRLIDDCVFDLGPPVVVDASGRVLLAWRGRLRGTLPPGRNTNTDARYSLLTPGGWFGTPGEIASSDGGRVQAELADDGSALLVWVALDEGLDAAWTEPALGAR